jgi:hypothetical protein
MRQLAWKADSMRQFGHHRLENVEKVFIRQWDGGTAHIAPHDPTFPGRRKNRAKTTDRPSRSVRPLYLALGPPTPGYSEIAADS